MSSPSSKRKIPFSRAFIWILLATLVITGSATLATLAYHHTMTKRKQDPFYTLSTIVSNDPTLPTEILKKRLLLPANLYLYNTTEALKSLESHPIVKSASLTIHAPNTLLVNYQKRLPIALLTDLTNTAIDSEGYLIPYHPFYTETLPEITLGITPAEYASLDIVWGAPLHHEKLKVVFQILEKIETIDEIDVSHLFSPSYGEREILLKLGEVSLRLSPKDLFEQLANFAVLEKRLGPFSEPTTIDMRLSSLAFVSTQRR